MGNATTIAIADNERRAGNERQHPNLAFAKSGVHSVPEEFDDGHLPEKGKRFGC